MGTSSSNGHRKARRAATQHDVLAMKCAGLQDTDETVARAMYGYKSTGKWIKKFGLKAADQPVDITFRQMKNFDEASELGEFVQSFSQASKDVALRTFHVDLYQQAL